MAKEQKTVGDLVVEMQDGKRRVYKTMTELADRIARVIGMPKVEWQWQDEQKSCINVSYGVNGLIHYTFTLWWGKKYGGEMGWNISMMQTVSMTEIEALVFEQE